jgi:hypothetical protein
LGPSLDLDIQQNENTSLSAADHRRHRHCCCFRSKPCRSIQKTQRTRNLKKTPWLTRPQHSIRHANFRHHWSR